MTPTGASNPQSHTYAKGQMLARALAALRPPALTGALTHAARPWANEITLF